MSSDRNGVAPRLVVLRAGHPAVQVNRYGVGGKAYNLMRLAAAGLPVPPGFVLTTAVCADYLESGRAPADLADLVTTGVRALEEETGLRFGQRRRPLLVAVRSGAAVSMPGMLETVLDVGLCEATLPGLLRMTGNPRFVWDSYRRLVQGYAEVVHGCAPAHFDSAVERAVTRAGARGACELDVAALRALTRDFLDIHSAQAGRPFPDDPMEQLLGACEAVMRSWNAEKAVRFRALAGVEDLAGTAVTVQAMVFGNMGGTSGSGVAFTRDPATGEDRLYMDFLVDAQGEDVVAGRHSAGDRELLRRRFPELHAELLRVRRRLEAIFRDAQDFEFTVQEGALYLLQTRDAKRTPWAALRIACDLVDEGLVDEATALQRLAGLDLDTVRRIRLSTGDTPPLTIGVPASPGAASGRIALDPEHARAIATRGDRAVLVRQDMVTDDMPALESVVAVLTARGVRTAHAAVVARQLGISCVVGCRELRIDPEERRCAFGGRVLAEGALITVDGDSGAVYEGELTTVVERPVDLLGRVEAWRTHTRGTGLRASG
jgi:pyruvate,orthophosphate dikinase